MKIWLFDIIEQFNFHDLFRHIKNDPFYIIDNIFYSSLIWMIIYWFVTTRKYGMYAFFKRIFFFLLERNLKEKFKADGFYVIGSYFFYGLALYIFWHNITAMIPESMALTAFLELPALVAFWFFCTSFFIALEQTKYKLPRGFLPPDVPITVGPFLYIIEFISYFIRLFSLAVRLFINLLAGHMLLKIFSILALLFYFNYIYLMVVDIIPVVFVWLLEFSFVILEYMACMLQAIVLVSLVVIYLDHSLTFFH